MSVEISADLPSALVPVAWMIGTWEGVGVANAAGEEFQFGERLIFTAADGAPALSVDAVQWRLDAEGNPADPVGRETGFWRLQGEGSVEVLLASMSGAVEVYFGTATGGRAEIATDLVGRTPSAEPYTAGHRLYGSVEGDLLYVYEAAFDRPAEDDSPPGGLAPLRSARLHRVAS